MGTAALAGYQRWADGGLRCRRAEGSFLQLAGKEWGCPLIRQVGEQAGAQPGVPPGPEKCHHLSTMAALAGESLATRNAGFSSENECALAHQTSGRRQPSPVFHVQESYRRQELEDTSALNSLCQGTSSSV